MREAVERHRDARRRRADAGTAPISVALTTALWDARRAARLPGAGRRRARDAGSLQLLDTALWIMSLAELTGGTPSAGGEYIEQVRELRRAIGYDAEHVVNAAYWPGPGRPAAGRGDRRRRRGDGLRWGPRRRRSRALAVRDLAEGHYARRLRPAEAAGRRPVPAGHPAEYPDFVEAAVRSGHAGRGASRSCERLRRWPRPTARPGRAGVAARSRALVDRDDDAEAALPGARSSR